MSIENINKLDQLLSDALSPESTLKFEETNVYHPDSIGDHNNKELPYSSFAIVIEDFEKGMYRFVNSVTEPGRVSNNHFAPANQKPLKTIRDLNTLWKAITGKDLTPIK